MVALQLGRTSILHTEQYVLVIVIGALGVLVNLGVAFVVGIAITLTRRRLRG